MIFVEVEHTVAKPIAKKTNFFTKGNYWNSSWRVIDRMESFNLLSHAIDLDPHR
jgi:hypothetical protein